MNETPPDRIEFRYSLGDVCLFRVSFAGRREGWPFNPAAAPLSLPLDIPEIPRATDVLVRSGQVIAGRLSPIHATKRALCYVRNQVVNHYIDLSGSFENYLKGFSAKTRSTLQRKVRKIAGMADESLECRIYRTPDSVDEFHRLARQIAVKTYQEKLFDGAIPASPEFVDRMRSLAAEDRLRGFILMVKGVPVSYLYTPVSEGRLIYGYLGYDPLYANWSPGTVLLYLALEQLFAERKFHYFDFTHGEGQAKELFGRASFLRADLYYFRWTPRNVLAVYGHAAMDWLSSKIGAILEFFGLRRLVRKLLRRL